MFLVFLVIILTVIFAAYIVFLFWDTAIIALFNFAVGWPIILWAIRDCRKSRKNIVIYLISVAISSALLLIKNAIGLDYISNILSRAFLIKTVQIAMLVFFIAQLIIFLERKIAQKKMKKSDNQ
jgi:hypothetical protein